MKTKLIALIPAFNPPDDLLKVFDDVKKENLFQKIVIVNDGSGGEFDSLFKSAAEDGADVIRNFVNSGKGAALRAGLNHIACTYPDMEGVVTFDADGQHVYADISKVAHAFSKHLNSLVIGCRTIPKHAPMRSRFGNRLTCLVFRLFTQISLSDTQSGLRAFPVSMIPLLLHLKTNGYDFEMDSLIEMHRHSVDFVEVPIEGVYLGDNESSHFNPIKDSLKIYFIFIRFASVSAAATLIDYIVFIISFYIHRSIPVSLVLARAFSASFQFYSAKRYVFSKRKNRIQYVFRYLMVLAALTSLSFIGIKFMNTTLGVHAVVSKIIVESALFFATFLLLRGYVFQNVDKDQQQIE